MSELKSLTPQRAAELLKAGARLVDIREPDEHARERIVGATLYPASRAGAPLAGCDGRAVIFHCRSGARTQAHAARLAAVAGGEAYLLKGGLEAWKRAGLPVAIDHRQPIDLQRQVQIAVGSLALLGTLLGLFVAPAFLAVPAAVGAGLMFAGATGFCGMAKLLARMPWNRRSAAPAV